MTTPSIKYRKIHDGIFVVGTEIKDKQQEQFKSNINDRIELIQGAINYSKSFPRRYYYVPNREPSDGCGAIPHKATLIFPWNQL